MNSAKCYLPRYHVLNFLTLTSEMMVASSFAPIKGMEEDLKQVLLVRSDACAPPNFQAVVESTILGDLNRALSSIPPKVLMIHDVRSCYMVKIGEVGDSELRESYNKLCKNVVLKYKFKHLADKGLTHALDFLQDFKFEWIKVVLS